MTKMKQVQISEKMDYIVKLNVTLSFEVNILQKFDNLTYLRTLSFIIYV